MDQDALYHDGMRRLQDARETRPLADRLQQVTVRRAFTDEDRAFIDACPMFFVATADAQGRPDCSYKGGLPGFVRVLDERTLAFPDYDGNGMYRSWGNVLVNPNVGLLFLDFERTRRLRVNGRAQVAADDPLRAEYPGAVFIIRVTAEWIFPNCPRYLHQMRLVEHSAYAPRPEYTPPVPAWKTFDAFRDALPARDRIEARHDPAAAPQAADGDASPAVTTVLRPMTDPEFAAWRAETVPAFAADKVASGQWSERESLALSEAEFDHLLPQGLATPGNHMFTIADGAGASVGFLWIAEQSRGGAAIAYVYDVAVIPQRQREGHARRAFAALEEQAARLGLTGIALHVFGHNTGARSLYEQLGFESTNVHMFKALPQGRP
ncbi:MAG TPA: GNAT family N-acetyltransferase [Burkholderiaceae bacterium]|nr:GNAT family N-acetyltransferase [Burkholderiaceae bacterium]